MAAPVPILFINNLKSPQTIAIDTNNNFYVADGASRSVVKIAAGTLARTVVGGGQNVTGVDVDANGNVFTCFGDSGQVYKNNAFWASSPLIQGASDLAVDSLGNVYISCAGNNCVVKIPFQ